MTFLVLYSSKYHTWKITDFGTSEEGASKKALQPHYARGYRAPELLRKNPECTNKVDIWATGCILFEIISGRKAFEDDREVKHFDSSGVALEPLLPYRLRPIVCKVITDLVNAILVHDPRQRPTAREINDEILRNVFGPKMSDDRRNEIHHFRLCTLCLSTSIHMLDGRFSTDRHLSRCKVQEEFAKHDLQSHKALLAGSRGVSTRFDALRLSPQVSPELAGSVTSFDLMGSPSQRGQRSKTLQGPHSFQSLPYERYAITPGPWHSYNIL